MQAITSVAKQTIPLEIAPHHLLQIVFDFLIRSRFRGTKMSFALLGIAACGLAAAFVLGIDIIRNEASFEVNFS